MFRKVVQALTLAVTLMVVVSPWALAGSKTQKTAASTAPSMTMTGTVTALDKKGMATVQTEEGKELTVSGKGLHKGDKVACGTQQGKTMCKKA